MEVANQKLLIEFDAKVAPAVAAIKSIDEQMKKSQTQVAAFRDGVQNTVDAGH